MITTMNRIHFPFLLAAAAIAPAGLFAQNAEDLRLSVGKSVVIDYPADIRQISTSNPDIIDASPVTTRELLLHGKGLGTATMVVWSKAGQRTFYNVTVDLNLDPLRKMLRDTFPGEQIEPRTSRDSISLVGTVANKDVAERAAVVASAFSKTVVNNLAVGSGGVEKQILLRVKFAELDRQAAQQYGVNLVPLGATNTIGRVTTGQFNAVAPSELSTGQTRFTVTDALNIFALRPDIQLATFIKALQAESILQILAEPNLVTTNGKEANFLVGGEFPVPVLQGGANASVTVQFREFGIRLLFLPQMTTNKTIKLYLKQEVSTIDLANAVQLNGFTIPALATRRAETNVELAEGQTFIVAGLVDNRETDQFSKIPVIGNIPILGAIFKSKEEKRTNSELVLMVTPEITEPLGPDDAKPQIAFPKDFLKRLDGKDLAQAPQDAKKGGSSRNKK